MEALTYLKIHNQPIGMYYHFFHICSKIRNMHLLNNQSNAGSDPVTDFTHSLTLLLKTTEFIRRPKQFGEL